MDEVAGTWEQVKVSSKDSSLTKLTLFNDGTIIKYIKQDTLEYIDTAEFSITEQWYSFYLNIYGFEALPGIANPSGKYKILKLNNEIFILQRIETWQLDRNYSYPFLRLELVKV